MADTHLSAALTPVLVGDGLTGIAIGVGPSALRGRLAKLCGAEGEPLG